MQMTKWIKLLAVTALVGAAVFSAAQGGGRQGRGGRGRGMVSEIQLAMRSDVQADLGVTDAEKSKLADLQEKMRAERRAGSGRANGAGAPSPADQEAMRARMQQMQEEQHKQLAEILTPEQMTRLGEIRLQILGPRALADAKVQKSLDFTADQTAKIKELQQKQQEANREIRDKMQAGTLSNEEGRELMQKNQKTLGDEFAKVLTAAQADKFKAMQGKPFKSDEPATPSN